MIYRIESNYDLHMLRSGPYRNKGMKKLCNYNVVGVNVTVNFLPFAGTIV